MKPTIVAMRPKRTRATAAVNQRIAGPLARDHFSATSFDISEALEAIKVSARRRINRGRETLGALFQSRFFDRALRTVKEYGETVEYLHGNPVRRGYVSRP